MIEEKDLEEAEMGQGGNGLGRWQGRGYGLEGELTGCRSCFEELSSSVSIACRQPGGTWVREGNVVYDSLEV